MRCGELSREGELILQDNEMRILRVPGLAIYYNEQLDGVPESFKRFLQKTPVLHETIIFLTVRQVYLLNTLLEGQLTDKLSKEACIAREKHSRVHANYEAIG